ncbi:hypothetical protein CCMSSC00406_0006186 [Pleurotus cornucopiae]|uniref:Uncharacterized protein n=1 Tax=Pleurotus cornucopiae TaxID=5321 RepID=A0ACB7J7N1_PLECO|nr:hypothetical protein CCMSSC00406_0006186 [Pleurotus cornucopiae]
MVRSAAKSASAAPRRSTNAPAKGKDATKARQRGKEAADGDNQQNSLDGLLDALKSNAKKNNGKSSGFTKEKQEIFTQGRANAAEASRKGIKHMDAAKQHLEELRNQEIGLDKKIEDMKLMWEANGSNLKAVLQVHPALVEDLFPRRKAETSAAADRIDEHKVEREGSLKTFLKHANTHLSRGREHEKALPSYNLHCVSLTRPNEFLDSD